MNNSPAAVSSFSERCVGKKQTVVEPFPIFTGHKIRVLAAYASILVISEAISRWVFGLQAALPAYLLEALIPAQISQSKDLCQRDIKAQF